MDYSIRLAIPTDRAQLVELLHIQLTEHHVTISRDDLGRGVDAVLENDQRGIMICASNGTSLIGVACVSFLWPLEHGGLAAWLEELYVKPQHREHGIGSKLLEAMMGECLARGCRAMDLEVEDDHREVEGLYRRFGFVELLSRRRWVKIFAPNEQ